MTKSGEEFEFSRKSRWVKTCEEMLVVFGKPAGRTEDWQ